MKKYIKWISYMTILILLVTSLAACGSKTAANTSSTGSKSCCDDPAPVKNVGTLKVAWFPATIKASLTSIAYTLGYFKEEGVNVECVTLQTAADAITAAKLGKVDIVPVGITGQLQFISEGSNLVIFGGSAMEGGAIITKPERAKEFSDWNNWKGKNWATGRSFTGDFVVRDHLRKLGIVPEKDVKVIDLSEDTAIIQAVSKGTADVGYITSDSVSIAKKMGLSVILKVADLDPGYPCCRQTANTESIKNKRDAFVAYQRALIRAYKVIQSDHEKAISVMMKLTGQNREYVETGLYGDYASKYNPSPAKKKVEQFYQYLVQEGVVKNKQAKVEDNIDTSIFKDALNQILKKYPNDQDYLGLKAFSDENDN
ncbi:MAG: ABC transporter substrate-binding protein [Bacillota bacterium]|nr:ABC transporter substrate-binding protein [Bacillota bacterium]